jgi:hypothetical protein
MTGKTSLAMTVGLAWAQGREPWPGTPPLPGTRVLVLSKEQPAKRLDALLRRLDSHCDPPGTDDWPNRTLLVARDPELPHETRPLFTLDEQGLELLKEILEEASEAGDPVGLLILDSLSRLKPPDFEEIDNDGMTRWLDALEAIAQVHRVYILLIHHQGHSTGGRRGEPRNAGRGASAISAVASVVLLLKRGKNSHELVLKVEGNWVLTSEMVFQVAPPDAPKGSIYFFRPLDPLSNYDPESLIGQEEMSTNQLARKLTGEKPESGKNPSGAMFRLAGQLRDRWQHAGLIEVFDGPRGSRMMRLKTDLATSPGPRPEKEAKSGNLTSPTAPIEARGGGEVVRGSRGPETACAEGEVIEPSVG